MDRSWIYWGAGALAAVGIGAYIRLAWDGEKRGFSNEKAAERIQAFAGPVKAWRPSPGGD